METFFASFALCAGNSSLTGDFPAQRPVTRSFDVFFDLRLNKLLNKQSWGWWVETPLRSLWRHCNVVCHFDCMIWFWENTLLLTLCEGNLPFTGRCPSKRASYASSVSMPWGSHDPPPVCCARTIPCSYKTCKDRGLIYRNCHRFSDAKIVRDRPSCQDVHVWRDLQ